MPITSSLTDIFRRSKGRSQKRSELQTKELRRQKVLSTKNTRGLVMLTAEVMTYGVPKSKKREQKPKPLKLDFETMRTSSPLLRMIEIVPKRTVGNLKARSRIKKLR